MNTYKFDKLSDLLHEIDNVIEDLTAKKKAILDKIDMETINIIYPESKGRYITDNNGRVSKSIVVDRNANRFRSFATIIDKNNYRLLLKQAIKHNESVSTFLKNRYFLNFINDKNKANNFAKDFLAIKEKLGDKVDPKMIKLGDRKTVGLALNANDSERLVKAARSLERSPRDLIRHLTNLFIYDYLINNKVREAYVPEDKDIDYIKCVSSNVRAYGYDEAKKILYVEFGGGRKYKYFNLPKHVFEDMCKAESKGQFVNKVLTPGFKYEKIN